MFFEQRLLGEAPKENQNDCLLEWNLETGNDNQDYEQCIVEHSVKLKREKAKVSATIVSSVDAQLQHEKLKQSEVMRNFTEDLDTYWDYLPLDQWGFSKQNKQNDKEKIIKAMTAVITTTEQGIKNFQNQAASQGIKLPHFDPNHPEKFLEGIHSNEAAFLKMQKSGAFKQPDFNPEKIWQQFFPNNVLAPSLNDFQEEIKSVKFEQKDPQTIALFRKHSAASLHTSNPNLSNSEIQKRVDEMIREEVHDRKKTREETKQDLASWAKEGVKNKESLKNPTDYITFRKNEILNNPKKYAYLKPNEKENKGDPFYGVIQFVRKRQRGEKATLTAAEYKVIHNMVGEGEKANTIRKEYKDDIQGDIGDIEKKEKGNEDEKIRNTPLVNTMRGKLLGSYSLYQAAMIDIATDANDIVQKSKDISSVISSDNPKISAKDLKSTIDQQMAVGHIVKNKKTDSISNSQITPENIVAKADGLNAILYYGVNTWGIITMIANIMVAIGNGNWEGAIPYIALGAGATWASGKAVLDNWIPKRQEPEQMPKWIMGELSTNEHYTEYFGNEWEVALANNINWDKKNIKKGIKNETDKDLNAREEKQKTDDTYAKAFTLDRKLADNQIKPEDFSESYTDSDGTQKKGNLSEFLPNIVLGPNGKSMTKEEFLKGVKAHGLNQGSENPKANNTRQEMLKLINKRRDSNDSFLPHLHSLHDYANRLKSSQGTTKHHLGPPTK